MKFFHPQNPVCKIRTSVIQKEIETFLHRLFSMNHQRFKRKYRRFRNPISLQKNEMVNLYPRTLELVTTNKLNNFLP